jgi:hypothetical protein
VRATLEETAKAVVERLGSGFWGSGSEKVSEGEKAFLERLASGAGRRPRRLTTGQRGTCDRPEEGVVAVLQRRSTAEYAVASPTAYSGGIATKVSGPGGGREHAQARARVGEASGAVGHGGQAPCSAGTWWANVAVRRAPTRPWRRPRASRRRCAAADRRRGRAGRTTTASSRRRLQARRSRPVRPAAAGARPVHLEAAGAGEGVEPGLGLGVGHQLEREQPQVQGARGVRRRHRPEVVEPRRARPARARSRARAAEPLLHRRGSAARSAPAERRRRAGHVPPLAPERGTRGEPPG